MKKVIFFTAALLSVILFSSCNMGGKAAYVNHEFTTHHFLTEQGSTFTKDDIKVIANYSDGTQKRVDGYEIEPALPYELEVGKNTFTITYKGSSETFEVYRANQVTTDTPKVLSETGTYTFELCSEGVVSGETTVQLKYVEFGDFAKEPVAAEDLPSSISETVAPNGWYIGQNGKYYGKAGDTYYSVSPMKWRVLSDDFEYSDGKTGKLLMAYDVVDGGIPYYETGRKTDYRTISGKNVYDSNYENSALRAYLNGYEYLNNDNETVSTYKNLGFLQAAFSTSVIEKLKVVNVKNGSDSSKDFTNEGWSRCDGTAGDKIDYTCPDTMDKVFVASINEITTAKYGFARGANESCETRKMKSTKYAEGKGVVDSHCWIRTPYYKSGSDVRYNNGTGYPYYHKAVNDATTGVVPCVVIGE